MEPTYTIGFDIGGTYIRGVLWNGRRVVKSIICRTPQTKQAFARALRKALQALALQSHLQGVGIGLAGAISGTRLMQNNNLKPLEGLDLRRVIPKRIRLKVDNDARTFLRGVLASSTHYRKGRVLGITLGTGVGRALAVNGKVKALKVFEYGEEDRKSVV